MDDDFKINHITGLLNKFKKFTPVEVRIRNTIQLFLNKYSNEPEELQKGSVSCRGSIIFINVHPYLKQFIIDHKQDILNTLKEKEQLFFSNIQ